MELIERPRRGDGQGPAEHPAKHLRQYQGDEEVIGKPPRHTANLLPREKAIGNRATSFSVELVNTTMTLSTPGTIRYRMARNFIMVLSRLAADSSGSGQPGGFDS